MSSPEIGIISACREILKKKYILGESPKEGMRLSSTGQTRQTVRRMGGVAAVPSEPSWEFGP